MNNNAKNNRTNFLRAVFYKWHIRIGALAAVFLLIIAGTGLVLNHTGLFKLDKIIVHNQTVMSLYGRAAPEDITSYAAGENIISLYGGQLYLGEKALTPAKKLVGAVHLAPYFYAATPEAVYILNNSGEIIEKVRNFTTIRGLGIKNGQVQIVTADTTHSCDRDLLICQEVQGASDNVPPTISTPAPLKNALQQNYSGEGVSLYRLLLDLHSGRLVGVSGKFLADLSALALIFLGGTGLYNWWVRKRKKKRNRKHKTYRKS